MDGNKTTADACIQALSNVKVTLDRMGRQEERRIVSWACRLIALLDHDNIKLRREASDFYPAAWHDVQDVPIDARAIILFDAKYRKSPYAQVIGWNPAYPEIFKSYADKYTHWAYAPGTIREDVSYGNN